VDGVSDTAVVGRIPDCDICKARPAVYDGKTNRGPWAYMCEDCWQVHGIGRLGLGFGQRLILGGGTR
jgi:hypothetical protein